MLGRALDALHRLLGRRYLRAALLAQLLLSFPVVLGGVALLTLFTDAGATDFARTAAVASALQVVEVVLGYRALSKLARPADPWLHGRDASPQAAARAWSAIAGLPLDFLTKWGGLPIVFNVVPIAAFATWELQVDVVPGFLALAAGATCVLLYGSLARFFAVEIVIRPVLVALSEHLPDDTELSARGLSVRAKLLIAVPAINIVGGVVVAGFIGGGTVGELATGIAVATAVALTLSLELSLLLAGSVTRPLRLLRAGTDRVAHGDYATRVPAVGPDEVGRLARSFNSMVAAMEERQRLREALGAYVAPEVAERVLAGGTTELAGEEVEVTVLFCDLRDFTAMSERRSARDIVALLNGFYARVVPVLQRHGGHADKFVGDGLLGVFGAPTRMDDHADRALACALEVVAVVHEAYGEDLGVGIGLSTGPVVAGTIGGGGRVEFTVIGDAVNTASRVEGATRDTGDEILLTEATRRALRRGEHPALVARAPVHLKGKAAPVTLHAVAEEAEAGSARRDRQRGAAQDVVLGDLDLVEAEGA